MKLSLGMIFAITALIALAISHTFTSWRLAKANADIEWLESARIQSWPDPELINVVSVDRPSSGFKPSRKTANWRWKILLPNTSKFRLHCQASPSTLDVAPESLGSSNAPSIMLPTGEFELDLALHENSDGDCRMHIVAAGVATDLVVSQNCDIFSKSGFRMTATGIRQTVSGDPAKPFLLVCVREYESATVPSEGLRIWIEPAPIE